MKESQFQTMFKDWIYSNTARTILYTSGVFELKIEKTKAMRFDKVKKHQIDALLLAKNDWFFHKISDSPIFYNMQTRFTTQKPFDCFFLVGVNAYVVIWFYHPRQEKKWLFIDIDDFITARDYGLPPWSRDFYDISNARKSLKEKEWERIAKFTVTYKPKTKRKNT